MAGPERHRGCILPGAAAGIVSLVFFLVMAPPFEETRGQARFSETVDDVMHIAELARQDPGFSLESVTEHGTDDAPGSTDPWDIPYRLLRDAKGRPVVLAAGEDHQHGTDDDIRSDLLDSLSNPYPQQQRRELRTALLVSFTMWLLLTWVFTRLGIVPQPASSSAHV